MRKNKNENYGIHVFINRIIGGESLDEVEVIHHSKIAITLEDIIATLNHFNKLTQEEIKELFEKIKE